MHLENYRIYQSETSATTTTPTTTPSASAALVSNRSAEQHIVSFTRSSTYQCTAIDFIRTLMKTGQFALVNFSLKEAEDKKVSIDVTPSSHHTSSNSNLALSNVFGDNGGALASFLSEINYCPATMSLALNLLISYELSYERKEHLKRHLMSNQALTDIRSRSGGSSSGSTRRRLSERLGNRSMMMNRGGSAGGTQHVSKSDEEEELNVIAHLHALMQQLFYEEEEKITSWQVRVRLVDLKHLIVGAPLGQLVYCLVEIGDKRFRTKEKQIDALNFEDDDEVWFI